MSNNPSISILMAVYNGDSFLKEALDSLLCQTLKDFELVVVDDASTDNTPAILSNYATRNQRIKVFRNGKNLRLPASLNCGLQHCRAPLVARADADDVYESGRLEKQIAYLRKHQDVGVVSCQRRWINESGKVLGKSKAPTCDKAIRFRLLFENCILHPGVVFRRELVVTSGGYDESKWTAQDYDLWARLFNKTKFAILPEALVKYRVHGNSISKTRGDAGNEISREISRKLLEVYLQRALSERETFWLKTLFHGNQRIPPCESAFAIKTAQGFLSSAARHETAEILRETRKRFAENMLGQSIARLAENPDCARSWFRQARETYGWIILSWRGAKQFLRLSAKRTRR